MSRYFRLEWLLSSSNTSQTNIFRLLHQFIATFSPVCSVGSFFFQVDFLQCSAFDKLNEFAQLYSISQRESSGFENGGHMMCKQFVITSFFYKSFINMINKIWIFFRVFWDLVRLRSKVLWAGGFFFFLFFI